MKQNSNRLIDALDIRIASIEYSKKKLESSLPENAKENRKTYYSEISYFVHTIWQNYDLKLIFEELLSYKSSLKNRMDYLEVLNNLNKSIESIAYEMLNHPDFENFERKNDTTWKNPFEHHPSLSVRILLERLQDLKKNELIIPYEELPSFFSSGDRLNGILDKWNQTCSYGFEKIISELTTFHENLKVLFYYEQFQNDYLGVNSAIQLQTIYRHSHPLFISTGVNESFYTSLIKSGEDISEANDLLFHCKKIKDYLRFRLDTAFSIDVSVIRFKHYMEIYFAGKISRNAEKEFQHEFELFMFNNGYFALSEGQVGNGRYDDIILDGNNAFLCEYKQIGFGKNGKESKESQIKKIQSAEIQTQIYHDRLQILQDLSKVVYIIIFSRYYLRFKNDKSDLYKNGLHFKFNIINLERKSPSKIKGISYIDIEDIIK